MIGFISKLLFSFICLLLTIGYCQTIYFTGQLIDITSTNFVSFMAGCVGYVMLHVLVLARREPFWSIVEHELTHALFAVLLFKKVHAFAVRRGAGGQVEIQGDNFIIALSPYFFPLLTVAIILFKPALGPAQQWLPNILMGFTLMFHLVHLVQEFHPDQPDLKKGGMIFSLAVVLFFNIFFIGLSLAAIDGQWAQMARYVELGLWESIEWIPTVPGIG